jgi:tetratricopeptide (TPR) repeat protein
MPMQRRTQPSRPAAKKPKPRAQPKRPATSSHSAPAKPAKHAKPARSAKAEKPVKSAKHPTPAKPARKSAAKNAQTRMPAGRVDRSAGPATPVLSGPSVHDRAVDAFERGFQALQQRQFGRASELLTSVVNDFPDEKEMQERARVYLAICERQAGREAKPRSFDERMNAATITVNRGAFDEGLALFRKLEGEDPDNDHVQYMLSVTYASVGNVDQGLVHLRNAIELAPENRIRAIQDPDLEALRQDPGFAAMADGLPRRRRTAPKKR